LKFHNTFTALSSVTPKQKQVLGIKKTGSSKIAKKHDEFIVKVEITK
jgi:hypothetical protein